MRKVAAVVLSSVRAAVLVKIVVGLALGAIALGFSDRALASRIPYFLGILITYGGVSIALSLTGRGRAATALATLLALGASPYSDAARTAAGRFLGENLFQALDFVQLGAFIPLALWAFVEVFPSRHLSARHRRIVSWGLALSLTVGFLLFVSNSLVALWPNSALVTQLERQNRGTLFWPILFVLMGGALATLLWRQRRSTAAERSRVRVFIGALVLGATPLLVLTIAQYFFPSIGKLYQGPYELPTRALVGASMLSIPFTTVYSVIFHRAVGIKRLLGMAVRYALSRWMLTAISVLPLLTAVAALYRLRENNLQSLLRQPTLITAAAIVTAAVVVSRKRSTWQAALDRRFFRDRYDLREALAEVAQELRAASSPIEVAGALERSFQRTLRLQSFELWLGTDAVASTINARLHRRTPPDLESRVLARLKLSPASITIDHELVGELADLSEEDRLQLVDSGVRVIIPLLDSHGSIQAAAALGDRMSETDLTSEDLVFAESAIHAASLRLELLRTPAADDAVAEHTTRLARQCSACHRIVLPGQGRCECGGTVVPVPIPTVLNRKFRLERKLGEGGMGVVYLALDVSLDRPVALKTLPVLSQKRAQRLRREAKTLARVTHPNLAMIYGTESWRGMPILVLEYLEAGTLAQRLENGPLDLPAALKTSLQLLGALEHLHCAGVLHRDIKPSNVGYSVEGHVKLLDFGVAGMVSSSIDDDYAASVTSAADGGLATTITRAANGRRIVGTPRYLSPEALRGNPSLATNDLWSFAVLLYESVVGRHPFAGGSLAVTLAHIYRGTPPPMDEPVASVLGDFLRRALSPRAVDRPPSAAAMIAELEPLLEA